MKVLVVGSGGREHALAWKIGQSARVKKLYCAPGNPGIAASAQCIPLQTKDTAGLLAFAQDEQIDLTVVGPEQPLAGGIVDAFASAGRMIFGPSRAAAALEWSKSFAKKFMQRHGIPTAAHKVFHAAQRTDAWSYGETVPLPVVIKADGLAAGKGVLICTTRQEVGAALDLMFAKKSFGEAGDTVVIEEYLEGEEASVFAVTDGRDFVTLAPAQDHKRVFDRDRGGNTGGMGAYAPAPVVTKELMRVVEENIIRPTLDGMRENATPYRGCLYVGLMLTAEGPKVVEYNCRFGDPEAQVVLPLYGGDLVDLLLASCGGTVAQLRISGGDPSVAGSAVCVVLASKGYPEDYETGLRIGGLDLVAKLSNVVAFHSGTKLQNGDVVTSGGRVLGITAIGQQGSLRKTIDIAYQAVRMVSFAGMHYRNDIGRRAIVD